MDLLFYPALLLAGLAVLISPFVLVVVVKRASPSRESSGAVVLTIASVILITGVWSMWFSPTYESRGYEDVAAKSLVVGSSGAANQTFTASAGQEIEVNIYSEPSFRVTEGSEGIAPTQFIPIFSVEIYDPRGALIWTQANVSRSLFNWPVSEGGEFRVKVTNPGPEMSLTLAVVDRSMTVIRSLEPAGQWFSLVSLPVFGLGLWFLKSGRRKEQTQPVS